MFRVSREKQQLGRVLKIHILDTGIYSSELSLGKLFAFIDLALVHLQGS